LIRHDLIIKELFINDYLSSRNRALKELYLIRERMWKSYCTKFKLDFRFLIKYESIRNSNIYAATKKLFREWFEIKTQGSFGVFRYIEKWVAQFLKHFIPTFFSFKNINLWHQKKVLVPFRSLKTFRNKRSWTMLNDLQFNVLERSERKFWKTNIINSIKKTFINFVWLFLRCRKLILDYNI